jgi:hypothetical protein
MRSRRSCQLRQRVLQPDQENVDMTGQYYVAPSISGHTLTLLGTGKAQVAGGRDKYSITSYSLLYDSSTNSWPLSDASAMNHVREFHTATLLTNGQVLVAGGFDGSTQYSPPPSSTRHRIVRRFSWSILTISFMHPIL